MSHDAPPGTEPSQNPQSLQNTAAVDADAGMPGPKDELSYLQDIITEQEKHAFTVMAFMSAVIAGLATLVLSWKTKLSPVEVLLTGLFAVFTFSLWTLSHRALAERAIVRVRLIEEIIRGGAGPYRGHQASDFLKNTALENWWSAARQPTFQFPFWIALGAVVGLCWLFDRNQDSGLGDGLNAAATDAFKAHQTLRLVVDAKERHALVRVVNLPQQCDIDLAKEASAAKWSVSTLKCDTAPTRADAAPPADLPVSAPEARVKDAAASEPSRTPPN